MWARGEPFLALAANEVRALDAELVERKIDT